MSKLFGRAMFRPSALWGEVLRDKRDAGWVFVLLAIEALLMQPESSARAIWAIERRGLASALNVLRLCARELVIVLVASYVLAFVIDLALRKKPALDYAQLASLLPWAFVPKVALSAVFACLWALKLAPGEAMLMHAGFARTPLWTASYVLLGYGAVAWSLWRCVQSLQGREAAASLRGLSLLPALVLTLAIAAMCMRVGGSAALFRPVGRGDAVKLLRFKALDGSAPLMLAFPRARPVVIDFWASWCAPCVEALPQWQKLATNPALDADFISVNTENEDPAIAAAFLRQRGMQFPAYTADDGTLARFQVETLPTLVVISADGLVSAYFVGLTREQAVLDALASGR